MYYIRKGKFGTVSVDLLFWAEFDRIFHGEATLALLIIPRHWGGGSITSTPGTKNATRALGHLCWKRT